MAEFPDRAKVVIIGLGGIVGASVAHHLIERGWDDIVGIDKSGIPTDIGSTAPPPHLFHSTTHEFLCCGAHRPPSPRPRPPPTAAIPPATISCPAGRRSTPSISTRSSATMSASAAS